MLVQFHLILTSIAPTMPSNNILSLYKGWSKVNIFVLIGGGAVPQQLHTFITFLYGA